MAVRVSATTSSAHRWRLVLSAGGTMGAYWMSGALQALDEAGLDPRSAEIIVGTSAGAAVGAILACGHQPWVPTEAHEIPLAEIDPTPGAAGGHWWDVRSQLGLLRSGLLPPYDVAIPAVFGGLMPSGRFLTDHIEQLVWSHVEGAGDDLHRGLKVVAVDRTTGRRTVFGSRPAQRLPYAVAASCAIPGYFAPVQIGTHSYIDGGVHNVFNLDLALEGKPAPVLVLSALTGPIPLSFGPAWLGMRVFRGTVGVQLGRATAAARRSGFQVTVLEPSAEETLAMGRDLMSGTDAELAYRIGLSRTRNRLRSPEWRRRLGRFLPVGEAAG